MVAGQRQRQQVSIPRSEFWSFGQGARRGLDIAVGGVSIPRSEFWSFGHEYAFYVQGAVEKFQFLGRNSGRSDANDVPGVPLGMPVSIPRSEFWSFGPDPPWRAVHKRPVSIPRSEFWSFGQGEILGG